ncbi:uncharacterized protein LOC144266122 [Eretmochelys imbricata]
MEAPERQGVVSILAVCAASHLDLTLKALQEFGAAMSQVKMSGFVSRLKDYHHGTRGKTRRTLMLTYSNVAVHAPKEQLLSRVEADITRNIIHHYRTSCQDMHLKLTLIQNVMEISCAILETRDSQEFEFSYKLELLGYMLDFIKKEPLDSLASPVRYKAILAIRHLRHCDYKVVSPALRAVGNIVTGDDIQTQVILNCSALQSLLHLLSSPKESIKKEACWTISNITAGNRAQIQTVIDAHIFPALINILQTAEFRTRKEAAWAITNATSGGSAEQIKYLVELGCIKPLCDLLTVMDSKIVQVALNGLENILRLGEQEAKRSGTGINPYCALIEEAYGLDKIEFLQSHENQDIYQKAFDLIEHYFGSEDEDSSIAPQVDLSQQQYIFQQCEAPMEGFQL